MGIWTLIKTFFLVGKSSTYLYVLIGLAAVSVGGYIYILKNDNKTLEKEKEELIGNLAVTGSKLNDALLTNEDIVNSFTNYVKNTDDTLELMEAHHNQALKEAIATTKILERINYDKKTNDAVAAPVLVNAFNGLQQLQTNTTDHNKSKSSKTPGTK